MSFSASWLEQREPFDRSARQDTVIDAAVAALAGRPSVTIVDLACGTGSTLRALGPRIEARQNWRLIDNDLSLLARAPQSSPPKINVTATPIDINRDLEAALDGPVDLVTTSALLDLVSEEWLERFVVETAVRRLPVYAALSYDGVIEMTPADAADGRSSPRSMRISGPTRVSAPRSGRMRRGKPSNDTSASIMRWCRAHPTGCSRPQHREMQVEVLSGWAAAARDIGQGRVA